MNRRTVGGIVAEARRTGMALTASIGLGLLAPSVLATPTGGEFITPQGGGGIYQFGDVTNVLLDSGVALNRHIIDWQGLNLAPQESLNFVGLEGYRVLNRVVGSGATQIDGILNASTGHVYVVNAAGVIFGQGAVINASSMHAAAAAVTNEDFLSGDSLTFDVGPGAVEFHGTLNGAQQISLIGSRVVNTSDISAGMIVMAVGDTVILKDLMNSRISVEIDGSDINGDYTPQAGSQTATIESGDPALHNSGSLDAGAGGGVTLAAGDLLGLAIQHDGEIRAAGGDVDIVAQGGAVWTSMENPDVGSSGLIDVSATSGAGTIDIIGSAVVQEGLARAVGNGGSVAIRSFSNTVLGDAARIDASGGGGFGVADAGTIVLESTDGTVYAGQPVALVANGGAWGGNGGDVTISGASLDFLPVVRQAASGSTYQNGSLVITASGRTRVIASTDPLSPVDYADLSSAIVAAGSFGRVGASVDQTLGNVAGALTLVSTETLRVQSSLSFNDLATLVSSDIQLAIDDVDQRIAAPTLTLVGNASMENHATLHGDESLHLTGGSVTGDGVSSLTLEALDLAAIEGDLGAIGGQIGSLTVLAGPTLEFSGDGNDLIQSVHVAGDLTIAGSGGGLGDPIMASATHDFEVRADGDVSIAADGQSTFNLSSEQGLDIQAGGSIDNQGTFTIGGTLAMQGGEVENSGGLVGSSVLLHATGGDLTTSGLLRATGTTRGGKDAFGVTLASASDLLVTGTGIEVAPATPDGFVTMTAGGALTMSTTVDAPTAAVTLTSEGGGMAIQGTITSGVATLTSAGDLHLDEAVSATGVLEAAATGGHLAVGATVSGGSVALSGERITVGETVTSATTLSAVATGGDLDVNAAVSGESIDLSADAGVLTTRVALESGELSLSGGAVVAERTLKATADRGGGDITLHAATGDLRLDEAVDAAGALAATADMGRIAAAESLSGGSISLEAATGMSLADVLSSSTVLLATTATGDVGVGRVQASGDVAMDVAGGSLAATGPLHGDDVDVAASGTMDLTTVTADAGLSLTSGDALNVETAASSGDLTIDAGSLTAGALSGSGVDLSSASEMNLTDVTAAGDLTATAAAMTATGELSGVGVELTSASDMNLAGVTASGDLTIDAGSLTAGALSGSGVDLSSASEMNLTDVTAAGDLTATAAAMTATGELSGVGVELTSASDMNLTGVTASGDLTLDAGTLTAGALSGSGVDLSSASEMNLTDVTAAGDLTATAAAMTATGELSGVGVELTSASDMNLTGVTASGDLTLDAGTLTAGALSGSGVDLSSASEMNLTDVTAAGDLTATAAAMTATGELSGVGVELTSASDMDLAGVTAAGDLRITADGVTSSGQVTGGQVDVAAASLMLSGGGLHATAGDLTLQVDAIHVTTDVAATASEDLIFGAGGSRADLEGDLTLQAGADLGLNATIDGNHAVSATASDELLVSGDVGAAEAVSSLSLTADRLVLAADAATIAATGDVTLNDSDRASLKNGLPSVYGFGGALSVRSRDGDIRIGSNQGLAYLGDLTLSAGDELVIGDVTALGDLTLRGASVVVQRRGGEAVLTPSGSRASPQTSIVSGGDLLVEGTIALSGSGADPRLAGVDSTRGVPVEYAGDPTPFTAADMELSEAGQNRLALIPLPSTGPSPVDPSLVAAESHLGEVEFEAAASDLNWRLLETEVLAQLGIEIVEGGERPSGGRRFARAGFVESELSPTLADPSGSLIQVVRSRLDPKFVQRAVVAYADVVSTGGEPGSLTDAGTVLRAAESAWREQPSVDGERPAYRQWLSQGGTPLQQDAHRILASLQTTYEDLHRAGLTSAEIDASRRYVASRLGDDGGAVQLASTRSSRRPKS
ncbi:MAG: filamentous hemagglutinin N-terminal domain-containing protein [Phycisphaerales bacterium]|nr:filamentous hemagglutinin N-terminal domain-containing protein [Phycisphaerales bacterium]